MTEAAQVRQKKSRSFGTLTTVFGGLALLCGGGAIAAELMGIEPLTYILKPLTMALIILMAMLAYDAPKASYKQLIIIGLLFSLAGDVLLMLPFDLFLYGLIAFAVAQLIYSAAFIGVGGPYFSWKAAIPLVLYGVFMAVLLWPNLGAMLLPAMAYLVIMLFMFWQSLGQWRQTGEWRAQLAVVGALLFVASDSLLAVNRFLYELELAPLLVLGTYYPAQWLISLSSGRKHR